MLNVNKLKLLFGSNILIFRQCYNSSSSNCSIITSAWLSTSTKSTSSSSSISKFFVQARFNTTSHKKHLTKLSIRQSPFQFFNSKHKLLSTTIKGPSPPSEEISFDFTENDDDDGSNMNYFVIGVSGVTCGGKTSLTKLLQKSFPWSRVIHQDAYFYPDEYKGHIRIPEIENHVNYDIETALDMHRMHRDVLDIIESPPLFKSNGIHNGNAPNFEGLALIQNLEDLDIDTSKYSSIPILIIEGFTIFGSENLYENSDVRFFLTLDEETCRVRRSLRNFDPPDCPGYFENCIWPEYQKHYKKHIENRSGIYSFSGKANIRKLWRESVEAVVNKMEEKFPFKSNMSNNL